jgi:Mg2+-importing ATPase
MINTSKPNKTETGNAFWSISSEQQLKQLATTNQGLSNEEANQRIKRYGANRLNNKNRRGTCGCFWPNLKVPLF